ncbi:uncharacterized protein LOC129220498 [Uloborus diversus]|uniref:uncharacterized protein LOC129220498 n=1 Tax=Uloborus diversus TaxID=327109 RepID=UPI00240A692F|nr:uncharacterized protein LOC129220498 [Uloborus diversus]
MASRYGHRNDIRSSLDRAAFFCSQLDGKEDVLETWRKSRLQSIKAIRNLRKRIDDTHYGANVARATGTGMCLFGEFLKSDTNDSRRRNEEKRKPSNAGDFLEALGSILAFGAELVEMGVTAFTMSEVKEILETDKQNTESLQRAIQFSSSTSDITNQIFKRNGFSQDISDIMKVFGSIRDIMNKYSSRFAVDVFDTIESNGKYSEAAGILEGLESNVLQTLRDIVNDPILYDSMNVIYQSWRSSPFVRRTTKLGLNMIVKESSRQSSALQSYSGGFLKAVGMASDAMEIMSLVSDLKEDRKTEDSERLLEVENQLTHEMNRMNEIYKIY